MRPLDLARRRCGAWLRVLEAVADLRDGLEHRIQRADVDDTPLPADVQTWCELARALADFIKTRRWN